MLRDRGKTMFDATDLSALDPKYFSIIFTDAFDVTIMSRNIVIDLSPIGT